MLIICLMEEYGELKTLLVLDKLLSMMANLILLCFLIHLVAQLFTKNAVNMSFMGFMAMAWITKDICTNFFNCFKHKKNGYNLRSIDGRGEQKCLIHVRLQEQDLLCQEMSLMFLKTVVIGNSRRLYILKFMQAIAVHEAFHHVEFHIQYGIQYGLLNFLYYNKDIRGIQGWGTKSRNNNLP